MGKKGGCMVPPFALMQIDHSLTSISHLKGVARNAPAMMGYVNAIATCYKLLKTILNQNTKGGFYE
jgi:hypothetical protein